MGGGSLSTDPPYHRCRIPGSPPPEDLQNVTRTLFRLHLGDFFEPQRGRMQWYATSLRLKRAPDTFRARLWKKIVDLIIRDSRNQKLIPHGYEGPTCDFTPVYLTFLLCLNLCELKRRQIAGLQWGSTQWIRDRGWACKTYNTCKRYPHPNPLGKGNRK